MGIVLLNVVPKDKMVHNNCMLEVLTRFFTLPVGFHFEEEQDKHNC